MERFYRYLIVIFIVHGLSVSFAQEDTGPILGFQNWKSGQVLDAQNRTVRLSNRLTILKSGKSTPTAELLALESELRGAVQNLDVIRELSLEDYVLVYLSNYHSNNKALESAAQGLNEAEITELIRLVLRASSSKVSQESSYSPVSSTISGRRQTTAPL